VRGAWSEAAPQAAAFIRAALAVPTLLPAPGGPLPRLLGGRPPTPEEAVVIEQERGMPQLLRELPPYERYIPPADGALMVLTEDERRMIEKERARAERNHGDEEDGNGGIPT
jgi:hypothetical protein